MTSLASSSWVVPPAHGDGLQRIGAVDDAQHLADILPDRGRARMVRLVLRPGGDAVGGGDAPDGALRRAYHPGLPLSGCNRIDDPPGNASRFSEKAAARSFLNL